MEQETKKIIKFLVAPLLVAVLLVQYYGQQEVRDGRMHVNFYDVGQGDAFLIETLEGNQILVDGGPGDAVLPRLANDMGLYDKTIEMMVLTHAHLDHFEGLIAVMKKYQVEKILLPNVEFKSDPYLSFLQAAKGEGAEIFYAVQGQRWWLDKSTVLDVLYPTTQDAMRPKKSSDINDTSIVAILRFGETKMLLTGDAGTNIEEELLKRFNLDADVLKVGHHGSKHSTSEDFLKAVTPEFGVIQLGENNYGHPSSEVIDRLNMARAQIFQSDQHGDIELVSNGSRFTRN